MVKENKTVIFERKKNFFSSYKKRILCFNFAFETIHLIHSYTFMISTSQKEMVWIKKFKSK